MSPDSRSSLLIARDETALANKAAHVFMETVNNAVRERKRASVALSGGSIGKGVLPVLADSYFRTRIPWTEITFFWADERCVPPKSAESNYGLAKETLLSKVPVPEENIIRIPGEMESPLEAAKTYQQSLQIYFGKDVAWPRFDLILLGIGEDGHTASLFPGTTALKDKVHWVSANIVQEHASNRITLTLPVLNNARTVLFLCSGLPKAGILREILRDDLPKGRFPAQLVMLSDGDLIWLIDKMAASKLPKDILVKAGNV